MGRYATAAQDPKQLLCTVLGMDRDVLEGTPDTKTALCMAVLEWDKFNSTVQSRDLMELAAAAEFRAPPIEVPALTHCLGGLLTPYLEQEQEPAAAAAAKASNQQGHAHAGDK